MKNINDFLYSDLYSSCIKWINDARKHNITWDEIKFARTEDEEGLKAFLDNQIDSCWWPELSVEDWYCLVDGLKENEPRIGSAFLEEPKKGLKPIPPDAGTCWQKYKHKLIKSGFSYASIENIEQSAQKVTSQLELGDNENGLIRGMVVGNVQSGKTANMAGVMAMAADYGINFFIVLTGTIDSLRKQTRDRLIRDLDSDNCNISFTSLEYLSPQSNSADRLQNLMLGNGSRKRYLTVCLKNSTRLTNLLNWLNMDQKAKSLLKVMVIDDEADQAGVNTRDVSTEEQTAISRLIKNIVFGKDAKNQKKNYYKCMNYIGYTATPYANFLNESGNDTLYPNNFISVLTPGSEYIGPQQIFGVDGVNKGLNILNEITSDDVFYFNHLSVDSSDEIPDTLKEALFWYICTVAIFRFRKIKKPVSMLIHTSARVNHHYFVGNILEEFFKSYDDPKELINEIEEEYIYQTDQFSIDDFKLAMESYEGIDEIKNYPSFDQLVPYIQELLGIGITHIQFDEESKLTYNKGIHLCIDNCKRNTSNDDILMRIVYPEKNDPILEESPAFIIIGGATLSRGLTLEGLTTSYFMRTTNQADTLMQMGRWFGYRKHYELLPRLWLSETTTNRFARLTKLDYDLRNELLTMEINNLSPQDYGPKLDSFPDYKLLVLTSKNKMQSSFLCSYTFYNRSSQTTWFYKDNEIIDKNFTHTLRFLNSLGNIDKEKIKSLNNPYVSDSTLMWFDVGYRNVLSYLSSLNIPSQAATFDDVKELEEWYTKQYDMGKIKDFTIIAGGVKKKINNDVILDNGLTIHLETRARVESKGPAAKDYDKYIDLSTITQLGDRFMDIDCSNFSPYELEKFSNGKIKFLEKRLRYAPTDKPLLIVYIIDKDSGKGNVYDEQKKKRYHRLPLDDLNLSSHIVGYYIYIPYSKYDNDCDKVTVKLNYEEDEPEVYYDEV